jgi:flagellar hook-basal body complex protein FliE
MADPLGLIGQTGGLGGVNPAAIPRPIAGGVKTDPNAPSFKDLLMENIKQVNKLQAEATTAIEDLNTGKRGDVEGVLLATQKADTAFRMLVSVRNKLTQAYEEIKQLRV